MTLFSYFDKDGRRQERTGTQLAAETIGLTVVVLVLGFGIVAAVNLVLTVNVADWWQRALGAVALGAFMGLWWWCRGAELDVDVLQERIDEQARELSERRDEAARKDQALARLHRVVDDATTMPPEQETA